MAMSKTRRVVVALGMIAALVPAAYAAKKTATVTIVNQSEWRIDQLFLSATDSDDWGPDQLGATVIGKNESFKITDIPCDAYDVKLVDEDGDECVVESVDLCGTKETWTITSKDLLACQAS
jgi:hypothetical protein